MRVGTAKEDIRAKAHFGGRAGFRQMGTGKGENHGSRNHQL